MRIKCPHCKSVLQITEDLAIGQNVRCTVCNLKFPYSGEEEHDTTDGNAQSIEQGKEQANGTVEGKLDVVIKKLNEVCATCKQNEKNRGWQTFVAVLAALIVFSWLSNMPGCHINVDTEYTNGGVKTNYY